jgi:hypothetical protein
MNVALMFGSGDSHGFAVAEFGVIAGFKNVQAAGQITTSALCGCEGAKCKTQQECTSEFHIFFQIAGIAGLVSPFQMLAKRGNFR